MRRHIWGHGVGDAATLAAAGSVIKDLWDGNAGDFLVSVATQRALRDRYLGMITEGVVLFPPFPNEEERAASEAEDLLPVGLAGKALVEDGLPVTTAVYLSRLAEVAEVTGLVQAAGDGPPPGQSLRGTRSGSSADAPVPDEQEEELLEDEEEDSESEDPNPGKAPEGGGIFE